MNTWKWVMRADFSWELVLHLGSTAATAHGSVQICNETESELLLETEDERVPETEFGFEWETEEERLAEMTEEEMVPETQVELVPAQALAPSVAVAEPSAVMESPLEPYAWPSEEARISYYKFLAIYCPLALTLI